MIAPLGAEHAGAILLAIGGCAILSRRLSIRARRRQTSDRLAVRRHLAERREAISKRIKHVPNGGSR